jgi:hypothetical protein
MTPKRFTNNRSDFVAAVKASGVIPIKLNVKAEFSPEWVDLFSRLAGRKAHLGLSRLARYAQRSGNRARRNKRRSDRWFYRSGP